MTKEHIHSKIKKSCSIEAAASNSNGNIANNLKPSCCAKQNKSANKSYDWLFIIILVIAATSYVSYFLGLSLKFKSLNLFLNTNYDLINDMSIGVVFGVIAMFMLDFIPKPVIYKVIGNKKGISGIVKAIIIGIVFDICSHGVLLIASKLYKQGVRLPQIIAFLCATPWNSLSLTFVMIALIGLKITIIFIVLSLLIAFITGIVFEVLLNKGYIDANPNELSQADMELEQQDLANSFKNKISSKKYLINNAVNCLIDSKMIIKWLLLGSLLAAIVRGFVPESLFQSYLGPTLIGLLITLVFAIILEICSQGALPIATELITKAHATGNAFAFLMAGVPTNYTQVMVLKELTNSWKVPLLLLLISMPQIIIISYVLNLY